MDRCSKAICISDKDLYSGKICAWNGHDIALVRLSEPMKILGSHRLSYNSPAPEKRTIKAGTGRNNLNTCRSLLSYQTVKSCGCGPQWYCTKGTFKAVSGSCFGDSGGPNWTFGLGLTGVTSGAPLGSDGCTTGITVFTNIAYYRNWIKKTMQAFETC